MDTDMSREEPRPMRNDQTPVLDLVIGDMRQRDEMGRAKYGTPLQPFNGRNAAVDAYQEVLDLAVYLRQLIAEWSLYRNVAIAARKYMDDKSEQSFRFLKQTLEEIDDHTHC